SLLRLRQFDQQGRELLRVISGRHQRLLVFQRIDLILDVFPFGDQIFLRWIVRYRSGRAEAQQRERRRALLVVYLGMLGREALLFRVETGGLLVGVLEGFKRGDGFVLIDIGRAVAQRFYPIAGEDGSVLFHARLGRGDHGAVVLLERGDGAAAGTGHIDYELAAGGNLIHERSELGTGNVGAWKIELVFGAVESSM